MRLLQLRMKVTTTISMKEIRHVGDSALAGQTRLRLLPI